MDAGLEAMYPTRRSALQATGAGLAFFAGIGTAAASEDSQWTIEETPIDSTLHDVLYTATNSHAVGEGGVLLERTDAGWELIFDGGPIGNGNDLYGAVVTDHGERIWLVGASGAIGEYDVKTGNPVDRSAPNDYTNNFNDVAVTGPAGDADVYVADDSGAIHYNFENGEEGTWDDVVPGSGSGLPSN